MGFFLGWSPEGRGFRGCGELRPESEVGRERVRGLYQLRT